MRKFLLLLIILIPFTASAQDLKNTPAPQTNAPTPSLEEMLQQTEKKEEMPKIGRDLANLYYESCINRKQTLLRKEARELICGCTSAKIAETLNVKEIQSLINNNDTTSAARDKLLMYVYAPCINFPAKDLARTTCMADPQFAEILRGKWKICECTADGVGNYIDQNTANIIVDADRINPDTLDPLTEFADTPTYRDLYKRTAKQCFNEYAYGSK